LVKLTDNQMTLTPVFVKYNFKGTFLMVSFLFLYVIIGSFFFNITIFTYDILKIVANLPVSIFFFLIIFTIFLLLILKEKSFSLLRLVSLISSSFTLCISYVFLFFYNGYCNGITSSFQKYITYEVGSKFLLNLSYSFALDGISVYFFFLTCLLTFLCILFIWKEDEFKLYSILLFTIQFFLLIIFSVLDLSLFYIFFEAILIPMYIVIGVFGSRERKIRAVYLFFFYTLCSSLLFLIGILYIYLTCGTFSIEYLLTYNFTFIEQYFLWFAFFLSFASKIPMFPFHIWLPEAHVEAPTVGSVLLAGVLLKLGVYGFIRFSLTMFPTASTFFSPFIYLFSLIGLIYASFSALRQTDLKRIIAYSSIAHMNLVILGLFSFNSLGVEGAVIQSLSHGFVASGLFFLIGIIYSRYHSRFVHYYSGMVHTMPIFAVLFLIFTMGNIALPGTSSFIGEFMLLGGVFKANVITGVISTIGVILSGAYSLWLYNRIIFGNIKEFYTLQYMDINIREFFLLGFLIFFVFFMGIFPSIFLAYIESTINSIASYYF